jgi:hypothetical protein
MPTNKLIDPQTDLVISRVNPLKFPENISLMPPTVVNLRTAEMRSRN